MCEESYQKEGLNASWIQISRVRVQLFWVKFYIVIKSDP